MIDLRTWQKQAWYAFQEKIVDSKNFVLVATPGCGKTLWALFVAWRLLRDGMISHIVVVCPSNVLCKYWAEDATVFGINLNFDFSNSQGDVASDFHGVAVTYHSVVRSPDVYNLQCNRKDTLVIFDEIHHASDNKDWGKSIRFGFDPARYRIPMSGTMFRSDNDTIPFVEYDENGVSKYDFCYGYGEALGDHVVRSVFFPKYEGVLSWRERGQTIITSFSEDVSEQQARRRLNAALDTRGNWLGDVIQDANKKLVDLREEHADAGGLIITKDKMHANMVARLVTKKLGFSPVVVTSDDADAVDIIEKFRKGDEPWIIAVKMVSEGVDIRRLRVVVYATNVLTPMYFRQAVGRCVRKIPDFDGDEYAYFFIPDEPMLVALAQEIMVEREHELQEELEKIERERESGDRELFDWDILDTSAFYTGTIAEGDRYTKEQIEAAQKVKTMFPVEMGHLDDVIVARILKAGMGTNGRRATSDTNDDHYEAPKNTLVEKKKRLRKTIFHLVARFVGVSGQDYADVGRNLNQRQGVKSINECTIDQLYERIDTLQAWTKNWEGINERSHA